MPTHTCPDWRRPRRREVSPLSWKREKPPGQVIREIPRRGNLPTVQRERYLPDMRRHWRNRDWR